MSTLNIDADGRLISANRPLSADGPLSDPPTVGQLPMGAGRGGSLALDPALIARDRLLDPAQMAGHLGRLLCPGDPASLTSAELVLIKYRWADSLRVVYRVTVGGDSQLVAARSFATAELADSAARSARSTPPVASVRTRCGLTPVTLDRVNNAVWWAFPHDRRLAQLSLLDAPPASLADLPAGRWESSEMVQYAPERSATARALDASGATLAFAKLYRQRSDAARFAEMSTRLDIGLRERGASIRTPRALAIDPELGVLLLEPMPGVGWTAQTALPLVDIVAAIGAGLGDVHSLTPVHDHRFERLGPQRLRTAADLVATARPDVAAEARWLGDRLLAMFPTAGPMVQLHGDVHPKNILIDGDAVSFIDFDQAGVGPAAADLGSMIARLRFGAVVGEHKPTHVPALIDAFLAGYRSVVATPSAAELAWHVAAALLAERALRAITRVHPTALAALPELLRLAHLHLDAIAAPSRSRSPHAA